MRAYHLSSSSMSCYHPQLEGTICKHTNNIKPRVHQNSDSRFSKMTTYRQYLHGCNCFERCRDMLPKERERERERNRDRKRERERERECEREIAREGEREREREGEGKGERE